MYEYVNKLNIAANPDKNEIAIDFLQDYPLFCNERIDENGNAVIDSEIKDESVSKIIINYDFAKKMVDLLNKILE